MTASEVLEREFLTVRAKLIDIAAVLDRIDRADGRVEDDPRLEKISQGLKLLADDDGNRTERLQMIFSLKYDKERNKGLGIRD